MGYQTERRRMGRLLRAAEEERKRRLERNTPDWKKDKPLSKKEQKKKNRTK